MPQLSEQMEAAIRDLDRQVTRVLAMPRSIPASVRKLLEAQDYRIRELERSLDQTAEKLVFAERLALRLHQDAGERIEAVNRRLTEHMRRAYKRISEVDGGNALPPEEVEP